MEFITTSDLHKYEDIINEIKKEFEKSKKLSEELNQENNNLVIHNLIKTGSIRQVSYITVMVFNNVVELYELFGKKVVENIYECSKHEACKFYAFDVYVSCELEKKLSKKGWFLHIIVRNDRIYISKSMDFVKGRGISSMVIPVPEHIVECTVEGYLVNTANQWMSVQLDTLNVDVSYHFSKPEKKHKCIAIDEILQLTKLYNTNLDVPFLKEMPPLSYQLITPKIDDLSCIKILFGHCIQYISRHSYPDLEDCDKHDFTIQIGAIFDKFDITFKNKDSLTIKANWIDLDKVKRYILKMFHQEEKHVPNVAGLMELKNTLVSNFQEAIILYSNTRKLSSRLPF